MELGPDVDYLLGGGVLDTLGIWFHHGLKVFICRSCQVCLTTEVLKGHCKARHQVVLPTGEAAAELQAFIERHGAYKRPEEVCLPQPRGPAVEGLAVPQSGFACGVRGCMYSVKDEGCMKRHERSQHMLGLLQALTRRKCMVQSLFQGIGKAYFEVVASEKQAGRSDLLEALSRVGASPDGGVGEDAAIATDKGRTPPALLRITGWAEHWPEVRASRALREKALALKGKRKEDELGGILQGLAAVVDQIFERGRSVLEGRGCKLTAQKMLMYGASIPSEG